jgi:hypothetical protein
MKDWYYKTFNNEKRLNFKLEIKRDTVLIFLRGPIEPRNLRLTLALDDEGIIEVLDPVKAI